MHIIPRKRNRGSSAHLHNPPATRFIFCHAFVFSGHVALQSATRSFAMNTCFIRARSPLRNRESSPESTLNSLAARRRSYCLRKWPIGCHVAANLRSGARSLPLLIRLLANVPNSRFNIIRRGSRPAGCVFDTPNQGDLLPRRPARAAAWAILS